MELPRLIATLFVTLPLAGGYTPGASHHAEPAATASRRLTSSRQTRDVRAPQALPSSVRDSVTLRSRSESALHASNETRVAWGTVVLAAATTALAAITGFLAAYTYRLWRATSAMAKEAQESSAAAQAATAEIATVMAAQQRAMDAQAAAASKSADVLGAQHTVMESQAKAMRSIASAVASSADAARDSVAAVKEQLEISKRIFVANNPPSLELRNAALVRSEVNGDMVEYTIVNVGASAARIVEHGAVDTWTGAGKPLPIRPAFESAQELAPGAVLESYDEHRCRHTCSGDLTAREAVLHGMNTTITLVFLVSILYEDWNDSRRRMEFRGAFNPATGRFVPLNGID